MYSNKEKLQHFRQLQNAAVAPADLMLLKQKAPGNTNIVRYELAMEKNADDILFELLDVCTHDEIVLNRREFLNKTDETPGHKPIPAKGKKAKGKKVKSKLKANPKGKSQDTSNADEPSSDTLQAGNDTTSDATGKDLPEPDTSGNGNEEKKSE